MRNAPDLASRVEPAGTHDACFLPRSSHVTGDIGVHEIAWGGEHADELWLVSTRFSCLCTLHPDYSFVPRWRPPVVTALAAEDRCHLNGLAMADGRPTYATALGRTDTPGGWRAGKAAGGCLMSVPDGRIVADGLCMPHSPRWHQGRLWVLESGTGRLLRVDPAGGVTRAAAAERPGFARGLALFGPYAFVGLSKIRQSSAMNGVPLAERRAELKSGVTVIDLRGGRVAAAVDFQSAVEEVFDVQVLAGPRFPEVVGFQKETLQHTFVVPSAKAGDTKAIADGQPHHGFRTPTMVVAQQPLRFRPMPVWTFGASSLACTRESNRVFQICDARDKPFNWCPVAPTPPNRDQGAVG